MIRLEIFERKGAHLYKTLVDAMRSGDLRTFTVKDRGRTVQHKRYPGRMKWAPAEGLIVGVLRTSAKSGNEWQLLSALVGRLTHRYADRIHSISIQLPEASAAKRARKRRSGSARKR